MKNRLEKCGYAFLLVVLSIIPIYYAIIFNRLTDFHSQPERHMAFLMGKSPFFNPWQYRVLAPWLAEGFHQLLLHTVYKVHAVANPYLTSFKVFSFLQHFLLLICAWRFYRLLVPSKQLVFFALILITWGMIGASYETDLAFNSYFEVLFYLWAAWIIFAGKNRLLFLPLTLLAALNRETSLLLPFLLLLELRTFTPKSIPRKNLLILAGCLLIYGSVFIGTRLYYGYQPPAPIGIETGLPLLRFNLTDPVTVIQLFATLSVLPFFTLFNIRKVDFRLQILFWLIVPAWFAIHFWLVWARETRLFLMPLIVVFIPIVLDLIRRSFESPKIS